MCIINTKVVTVYDEMGGEEHALVIERHNLETGTVHYTILTESE